MRRAGAAVLLVVAAIGLAALALTAATDKRDLAFTIGVVPSIPAAVLPPSAMVCQTPIAVSEQFDRVRLVAGSPGRAGSPLTIVVYTLPGRELARGRVPGGDNGPAQQSPHNRSGGRAPKGSLCGNQARRPQGPAV